METTTVTAPAVLPLAPKTITDWELWKKRFDDPEGGLDEKVALVKSAGNIVCEHETNEPAIFFLHLADTRTSAFTRRPIYWQLPQVTGIEVQFAALEMLAESLFLIVNNGTGDYWKHSRRILPEDSDDVSQEEAKKLLEAILDFFTPDKGQDLPFQYVCEYNRIGEKEDQGRDERFSEFFERFFGLIYLWPTDAGYTRMGDTVSDEAKSGLLLYRQRILEAMFTVAPWKLLYNVEVDPEHVAVLDELLGISDMGERLTDDAKVLSKNHRVASWLVTHAEMLVILKARLEKPKEKTD